MAMTFATDINQQRCTVRLTGSITYQDLTEAVEQQLAAGAWTYPMLIDATEATSIELTSGDVTQHIGMVAKLGAGLPRRGRIALATNHDAVFGMARMYQMFAELPGPHERLRVTRTIAEAEAWLAEDTPS